MTGKVFAKTIKLFLLDGIPNGRMTCELSNWTGKAYKLPRNMIKDSSRREELSSTGVYFLFGKSDMTSEKDVIYIGEAENIIKRLSQHLNEKDYWNEAVVLISKDDNLNKAHIKYLENRLHQIAVKVNRYEVKNSNTPTQPSISESDQAEMEEFIENIKMLVNVLGFKAFEELIQEQTNDKKVSSNFFIKSARGANAQGQQTSDGFVVLKDSEIASSTVDSYPDGWKNSRQELIDNGTIIEKNGKLIFSKDYLFNSPSAAAAIVMGRSANGLMEWKSNKGKSLKDMESVKS
ncbi:GIY-YIG nuclease family protein [Sulfurovum sp. ST-21]|uniref:GIY-YIG nuclease family protein n=1 Tax=Sulfurovum indicum TaxID=2779528 RepID=A0A7M1S649_9BACT|nr:GIY-YIG nuclease family protein [Sulfurovum indicum]QOR62816.1 GIY-YIG nuclease family protein [Sulfurovum indicum]